jgi:serine/threonine protein kinase
MVYSEMAILKNLDHPGIVKIYDSYTLPPLQVVLVMEYLEGGELTDYIHSR